MELAKLLFDPLKLMYREEFITVFLNRANKVMFCAKVGTGASHAVLVNTTEIYHLAIAHNVTSVILMHNHPSGNMKPSEADKTLTTKIKEGLKLFDIMLMDHIIIGQDSYYSFADNGELI